MHQPIVPIACRPWMLNGLSERLIVSHYENEYGGAVRTLNTIRDDLARIDIASAPGHLVRALKREELAAIGSVALHELYFANLGGDGKLVAAMAGALEEQFGSVDAWRREFVAGARALRGGSGWALLSYSRRDRRLCTQIGCDHAQAVVDAAPILALDMYEHAYHMDFGANAVAYIDAFLRNVDWNVVADRLADAKGERTPEQRGAEDRTPAPTIAELSASYDAAAIARLGLPSLSVEELADELARTRSVQVIDARPRHYYTRNVDMMHGATWKDPSSVDQWAKDLAADAPVFVYCAYGFHVGCSVTAALRERGFDARYLRGGLSAWYAAGGMRALRPAESTTTAA